MVTINKADINLSLVGPIESLCKAQGVDLAGRIPYDPVVTEAMVHGLPVTAYRDGDVANQLKVIWQAIKERLLSTGTAPYGALLHESSSPGSGIAL